MELSTTSSVISGDILIEKELKASSLSGAIDLEVLLEDEIADHAKVHLNTFSGTVRLLMVVLFLLNIG